MRLPADGSGSPAAGCGRPGVATRPAASFLVTCLVAAALKALSQSLTLPPLPQEPGAGTLAGARRCPVTHFCLLPQWQSDQTDNGCQDRHTERRNLLSEKLNFKYLTLKKRLTVQMYDMQLHSVKIDSEITQTEFPMKSYNYDRQTVQQRCSRKN